MVLPDDGILFASNAGTNGMLGRLKAGGGHDTAFEGNANGFAGSITALALQADGKILVGGYFETVNGAHHTSLARLNTDGTLDGDFAPVLTAGYIYLDSGFIKNYRTLPAMPFRIYVLPDGKILVGGTIQTVNNTARGGFARLNPDGTLDPSLKADMTAFSVAFDGDFAPVLEQTLLQPDGRVFVAGNWGISDGYNGPWVKGFARLLPNGSNDGSFQLSPDLLLSYYNGGGLEPSIHDSNLLCALQPDGRILITGLFQLLQRMFVRIFSDGSLDESFNADYLLKNDFTAPDPPFTALLSSPDGSIYLSTSQHIIRLANKTIESIGEMKLLYPIVTDASFTVQIRSAVGRIYHLESTISLGAPDWQAGAAVTGDGTMKTLTGALGVGGQSFYRVRAE